VALQSLTGEKGEPLQSLSSRHLRQPLVSLCSKIRAEVLKRQASHILPRCHQAAKQ
jgi:hypothetical protein